MATVGPGYRIGLALGGRHTLGAFIEELRVCSGIGCGRPILNQNRAGSSQRLTPDRGERWLHGGSSPIRPARQSRRLTRSSPFRGPMGFGRRTGLNSMVADTGERVRKTRNRVLTDYLMTSSATTSLIASSLTCHEVP